MRAVLTSALAVALLLPAAAAADPPKQGIVIPHVPPGTPLVELGRQLFAGNCAICHGADGRGIPNRGPQLRGVGALAPDFYLRNGYMPLERVGIQPTPSRPLFDDREIRAIVAYVASLGKGPPVPSPDASRGSVSEGQRLFADHCSGCHQIALAGGYLTGGVAPALNDVTPAQVAEAVRIGPYLMPTFPASQISDKQLNSLIAYVEEAQHPQDRGGWALGHIGPVPEGLVTWLLATAALVAVCVLIGRRIES
jgi:ubiquinol-cytochrome c reductase cytochrome c subunit